MGEPVMKKAIWRGRAPIAEFRQQLLTESLERLLAALNRMRAITAGEPERRPANCAKASISRSSSPTAPKSTARSAA